MQLGKAWKKRLAPHLEEMWDYLLETNEAVEETYGIHGCSCEALDSARDASHQQAREEEPSVLALTRQQMPVEMPKGKALENIKAMMIRVHKASGHSSFANLQRLLRVRGAPFGWTIEVS